MPPKVTVIVRTRNEERWIAQCLSMVFRQDYENLEVVIVDNCSSDHTLAIARRFPIKKIVSVSEYRPGRALNSGVREAEGEYLACLSAHCVPKETNWLSRLVQNLEIDSMVAGVYGRQLPVSFTDPVDKRDLITVFGLERRVQLKDYFFHNANSVIRKKVWTDIPFDEEVTNIEDRVWGKKVIESGFKLVYEPDAPVYHHHGLHQGNTPERVRGVVSIIEQVDKQAAGELPEAMRPENTNIIAVLLSPSNIAQDNDEANLLSQTIEQLKNSQYVKRIYIIGNDNPQRKWPVAWINREEIQDADNIGIDEILQEALEIIESKGDYPEYMLYANHQYLFRPQNLFDNLIYDGLYNGYDTAFPGYRDFGHYWFLDKEGRYRQTDASLETRKNREPTYRALYGQGTLSLTSIIRSGRMVGDRIGIMPLEDIRCTFRLKDKVAGINE